MKTRSVNSLDDVALVNKAKQGCNQAFIELFNRYHEKAFNLIMRITRHKEDANEVLQEIFTIIKEKINTFEGKSAFSSWLYRITVNCAYMKLRDRKKHSGISLDQPNEDSSESDWLYAKSDSCDINYLCTRHELRKVLENAIASLPADYRVVFVLRDVDGLSNEEAAKILDLSISAIKSRLHRARLMLRKKLYSFYQDYVSSTDIYCGVKQRSNIYKYYKEAA